MRVAIALVSSGSQLSGVQRHGINLARSLLQQSEVEVVYLIIAPPQGHYVAEMVRQRDSRLRLVEAAVGATPLCRNKWYYLGLPKLVEALRVDVVHLAYPVPLRSSAFDCPVAVTLHDLYPFDFPENFGYPKALLNRAILSQCLHSADAIACVSEATLARLERKDPMLALAKAVVVPNCVEPYTGTATDNPLPGWRGDPFLLCVAQHRRNKNLGLLLRTFHRLREQRLIHSHMRLVVLGIRGPETGALERFITSTGIQSHVVLLEGISEAALHWCYRRCELLVAPSLTEGFGLPVAEGLLAGCRVLCSDIAAFHEVGGTHCRYVTLGSENEDMLGPAILRALATTRPKEVLLPALRAEVVGKQYVSLYGSLLSPLARAGAIPFCATPRLPERNPLV